MRLHAIVLVVMTALPLSACQMMSGLDKLHAKPGSQESAQLTDAAVPTLADAATADGGSVMSSKGLPADANDLEHQEPKDSEQDLPGPMDSDAGQEPASSGSKAARSNIPLAKRDGGVAGPVVQPVDAGVHGRADEAGGAADPHAPEEEETLPACMPPLPSGLVCTVAPQCGCEAGENCAVDDDRLACIPAGTAELNQPCDKPQDCLVGFQCLSGACLQLCDASRPDCNAGAACMPLNTVDGTPIEGAHICESNCNLVEPDRVNAELSACGSGLVCVWSGTGSYCTRSDRARQQHGEKCGDVSDCAAGFVCTEQGTCAKWCGSSSDCPDAFSCSLDSPIHIGESAFGTCKPDCLTRTEQVCGLSSQCGCDAALSCDTMLNRKNEVVHECRDTGSALLYQACATSTDCARGAQCVSEECRPMCQTDVDCAGYSRCEVGYFPAVPLVAAGATCRRPCDPADPYRAHGLYGTCPAGDACDVTSDGASHCRPATSRGVAGVSCSANSDCAVGHSCTSEQACVQLCHADTECQGGMTCHAFAPAQYATSVEWGYCARNT